MNAEAQDASGTNNANFSTPADGGSGRMQMFLWTAPTPDRDGDADNGIIIHEYGHGISNRSNQGGTGCLGNQEQAGEGWSDYLGLMLTQNWATAVPGDGFNSPRGIGTYALNQPNNGPGIRPARYCTDFAVNNFTYANLPAAVVPHGSGFIFCTALWEMTWELINDPSTTGIDPNIYNFAGTGGNVVALRLVMEGLRTQQCQPGFISARNAIMRADTTLYGASHACAILRAFARRGMGLGAAEGSTGSTSDQTVSFNGGGPAMAFTQSGAAGVPELQNIVYNHAITANCSAISNHTLRDTLPLNANFVSATNGGTYAAGTRVVSWPVNIAVGANQNYGLTVQVAAGSYFPPVVLINEPVASTTISGFWATASTTANVWIAHNVRSHSAPNSFFTPDAAVVSDQTIATTASFAIGATPPELKFWHWYNSESGFDGGVLEISTNGGTTWSDIGAANITQNGYNGTISSSFGSPIGGRQAWTGNSTAFVESKVNLTPYANQANVKLRWRFASDNSLAATGWNVDDIQAQTIAVVNLRSSLFNASNVRVTFNDTVTVILPATTANPTVTINQAAAQTDPTSVASIAFTAVFSAPVIGFATGDVVISGTAGATIGTVTGGPTTYTVTVTNMTGSGTVIATIPAGVCTNAALEANLASTSTDNTVTYNLPAVPCVSTYSYTGPAVAVPDNTPAGVDIPLTVSGAGTITDLDFRFDAAPASTCDATVGNTNAAMDHTFIGDLVFTLTSPLGTTVTIVNRRGGTRENICTTLLDDDGAFPALSTVTSSSGQTLSGNFAPDNPLSAFDGQNANGVWTLNVSDNASVDIGSMRRFSLIISSATPTVNPVANQTVCAGSPTTAVNFTGTPAGATYNWTNSNTAIGLAASGTGNIASFTATNATAAPIVATITVTPTLGVCTGTPTTFTITVNPTPTVNAIPNQVLCQNSPTAPVNFTGTPAGVIFQWTNNAPAIGLAAAGTGNIPSFIAQNPGTTPLVATITVTPVTGLAAPVVTTYNFTGAVQTFTVPAGITSVNLKTWGAQGNTSALGVVGGLGGYAEGNLAVTPGQVLNVLVGGGAATSLTGGFNGGGAAGANPGCATAQGGGGGGASDVRIAPYALANRVIVGAGGGGAGGNRVAGCGRGAGGGGGGGLWGGGGGAAWPGVPGSEGPVPTGGTQVAGGAGGVTTFTPGPTNGLPGVLAVGGAGGTEIASAQGGNATAQAGGIGGGLTGGSGLYVNTNNWTGQSGAGGSSYIGGVSGGLTTPGLRSGAGQVQITYTPVSATTCFGTQRTFTITVNPNANLVIVADPGTTLCEGDPTLLTVYDAAGTSGPVSLTQSASQVPVAGSVSCNAGGLHTDNSYWRAYNLATAGLPSALTVTNVTFGIEQASGGAQPVTVNLYTQNAGPAFPGGTRTLVGTQAATVNNATLTTQTVTFTTPVVVSNTAVLIVELFTPSGQATGRSFFIGSNPAAQTGPSYLSAATCGVNTPTDVGTIGFPNMHIILNVGGTVAGTGPQSTGTFLWSPALGLSSTTSNPVAASPMNTTTYTVVRTTAAGCQASAQVTITVNKRPVVTTQPANVVRCVGNTATFTVGATGTGLTYQWQVSTAGCAGPWTNLTNIAPYSNVTTATLTVNPVTQLMSGYAYRCIVSGTCAPFIPPTNVSNCATLTVNANPNIAVNPVGPVCGGVAGINGTALSVVAGAPPVPGNVTVNSGVINVPIPDGTGAAATTNLTVAGVPANATITEIKVNMNINHTWVGDVDVNLRAPNLAILNLVGGLDGGTGGNATDNFTNTAFSSLGGSTISGFAAPRTGTFAAEARAGFGPTGFIQTVNTWAGLVPPATPLAANGQWTLAAGDFAGGDVGTITNWSISVDYTTPGNGTQVLSYAWSPLAGLYTNTIATTAYTGTNLSTVYAAPTVQTTYTVTATDVATGCFTNASVLVNYTPPAPTITPSSVTMCLGDPAVKLKATSSSSGTVTVNSGTLALAIPDGPATWPQTLFPGVATPNLAVSGVPAGATITGMSVKLNLTHTYIADMVIVLKAPNGNVFNLDAVINRTGGAGANFVNTVISSAGTTLLSAGAPPYTGTFAPDAAGATFVAAGFTFPGGPTSPAGYIPNVASYSGLYSVPNGNYTLGIYDWGAGDLGTLTNWELTINYTVGVVASAAIWSPAAGLFSDAGATTAYVAGTRVDSVWARPTPSGVYPYTATVNNMINFNAVPATPMAGGNGNNLVAFNVKNNNAFPVTLAGIASNAFGSGAVVSRAFFKPSAIAGNPGAISAANGWNQFGTANNNVTANVLNPLMSGLTLQILQEPLMALQWI
ncbi:MAG: M36 family metallopeptidase [Chitinophagaceae bacterium]|nr:M36 family metallopeptidase [Chitinophagaceae bacterium]